MELTPEEKLKIPAYQRKKKQSDYSNLIDHPQIPKDQKRQFDSPRNEKILVLNSGSSSLKAKLFEKDYHVLKEVKSFNLTEIDDHEKGIRDILNQLLEKEIILNFDEITKVGHRVVHGGEHFKKAAIIAAQDLEILEKISNLAPLHNPLNILGIKICKNIFSESTKQIAVFDTAFHQTMPEKAYLYGLPKDFNEKYGIRRYGFHGTSHKYVTNLALNYLKPPKSAAIKINSYYLDVKKNIPENHQYKIISCHLGNGSSITASVDGKSMDTSMGFTPLEGIMMGTRCGSIDPAIPTYLIKNHNFTAKKVDDLLNNQSGLLGFSGISNSMREIFEESRKANNDPKKRQHAKLTIEILAYQIARECGGYAAALSGLDALIFTGGMGENAFYLREKVCKYLGFLDLKFDQTENKNCFQSEEAQEIAEISLPASRVKVFVIKTDEEKQIALECLET